MPKNAVRKKILIQRRSLLAAQVREFSIRAQQHLMALPGYRQAQSIALYAPIHGEVETELLCEQALVEGKAVLFPVALPQGLEFRQIFSATTLVPGAFGILEPAATAPVWKPSDINLIVVPGVAFDPKGRRIGYGKGYYDRTLHPMEGSGRLLGLCYDFQLVDEIAEIPHDVRMDGVVTEHRVVCPCD